MRFPRPLISFAVLGAVACGPTYVVQGPPRGPVSLPAPEPPRTPPLEVSIVRSDEGRVLIQTSRQAYLAVFEIVPGRGVSLVYPAPMRPRNVQYSGLTWINVYWTMRADYRYASSDTRYIYAVASDTPLRLEDEDYNASHMQRTLGSAYWSSSPNATVRAIAREFVRAQPEEWWGEDMTSMQLMSNRVTIAIRLARVYCPDGDVFEVRDDMIDRVWCPARRGGPRAGERPGAAPPDSVFNSTGRRAPRRMDPTVRTPIFRVPAAAEVGQQQGQPTTQPHNPPATYPPQTPPPSQPPQQTPTTEDPNGQDKDHHDNGRRAHGDPRNADPRGNGNGYGNGGRNTPSTQPTNGNPPATVPMQSNPQTQPQTQPDNNGGNQAHGNGNSDNDHGKAPNEAKPDHADGPKSGIANILKNRGPQQKQDKKQDKKAASDSTDKKKP